MRISASLAPARRLSRFARHNDRPTVRAARPAALSGLAVLGLFVLGVACPAVVAEPVGELPAPLGETIADFELPDVHGQPRRLSDWADRRALVVAFLASPCPLSQQYAGRLAALAGEMAPQGAGLIVVAPHAGETLEGLAALARRAELDEPCLVDRDAAVATRFAVERVPEVFVLDADRVVRYRGRIDDQYSIERGRNVDRAAPRREDLRRALESVLAGQPVEVPWTEATGCLIARPPAPSAAPSITWSEHVAPLFAAHCVSCHAPGEIGPMPLLTYDEAASWATMIAEVVGQGRMPPWHANPDHGEFRNANTLSDEERRLIAAWVAEGAALGAPTEGLAPVALSDPAAVWHIGTPDQVIAMAAAPFEVPAEGTLEYQYFVVDPQWRDNRWIAAAECRPGNTEVVHHINVFVIPPAMREQWTRENLTNYLLQGFAPGFRATPLPAGHAIPVEAGSQLVFQMHYTPVGVAARDLSSLALRFAADDSVTRRVDHLLVFNDQFQIPPRAAEQVVTAQWEFADEALVHALIPHMHLRGSAFRYEVFYPDSRREVLLDVPRYDFNWQHSYELVEPQRLPAGTIVEARATFDNSADNPANPDSAATVGWGDQTTDEMMIGYMQISRPRGAGPIREKVATAPPLVGDSLAGLATWGLVAAGLAAIAGLGWIFVIKRRRAPAEISVR